MNETGAGIASLDEGVQRWAGRLAVVGLIGLVVLAALTIADVFLRYFFSRPIDGLSDVGEILILLMVAGTFPATYANRQQLAIRALGDWLGPRARSYLDLFAHLSLLAFVTIVAWQLVEYTVDLQANGQTTWMMAWPLWPSWAVASALVAACVPIQSLVVLAQLREVAAARAAATEEKGHG